MSKSPTSEVVLRLAAPEDAEAILEVNQLFHLDMPEFRWTTRSWVQEEIQRGTYLVAEIDSKIVGALCYQIIDSNGYIEAIAVRKDVQGMGVGRLFVDWLIKQCKMLGLSELHVESFQAYGVAGFYTSVGFTQLPEVGMFEGHPYGRFIMPL